MSEEFEGMTHEEVLAVLGGEDPDEAKTLADLNRRIYEESRKYVNASSNLWPQIVLNWDTSVSSQRYSLDGVSLDQFKSNHPSGFVLGYVSLIEIDSIMHSYSRRDDGELWQVGSTSKLARLIVYLSENRPISPPLVKPVDGGEIILQGGHHRYAIAKEIGEERIPIHTEPKYKIEISSLLSVEWQNA